MRPMVARSLATLVPKSCVCVKGTDRSPSDKFTANRLCTNSSSAALQCARARELVRPAAWVAHPCSCPMMSLLLLASVDRKGTKLSLEIIPRINRSILDVELLEMTRLWPLLLFAADPYRAAPARSLLVVRCLPLNGALRDLPLATSTASCGVLTGVLVGGSVESGCSALRVGADVVKSDTLLCMCWFPLRSLDIFDALVARRLGADRSAFSGTRIASTTFERFVRRLSVDCDTMTLWVSSAGEGSLSLCARRRICFLSTD